MEHVKAMLAALRVNYLNDLLGHVDEIEGAVLDLDRIGFDAEIVQELFRRVHSLKGSAGTYGLNVVSDVCHPFEDLISDFLEQKQLTKQLFIDFSLRYIDLLHRVCNAYSNNEEPEHEIQPLLHQLRVEASNKTHSVLVVENSDVVVGMLRESLLNFGYRIEVVHDGYVALGRLLAEPFDLLVTALETKRLNGIATISALQKSQSRMNKTMTILLSSTELNPAQHQADFTLVKNAKLKANFLEAIQVIDQQLRAQAKIKNKN
jgi:chemotaxis protein histidine kinase CheA